MDGKVIEAPDALHWIRFNFDHWQFHIAATAKGLCYTGSPGQTLEEVAKWAAVSLPNHVLQQNDSETEIYSAQFKEFFQGRLAAFTVPLDLHGTAFQQTVWNALADIPYGETLSYSEVAARIGQPNSARAVGTAIGANPLLVALPCHRVIGKNGRLAGYRGGLEMKRMLLKLEQSTRH